MKKFFATQIVFTVSYWIILPPGLKSSCTEWKLAGGRQEFEGLVEVQFNGEAVNICSKFDNIEDVCKHFITSAKGTQTCHEKHTTNVFGAKLSNSIIELASCNKTKHLRSVLKRTCQKNERADDCCEAVSVCCCEFGSLKQCSANWSTTLEKVVHPNFMPVTAEVARALDSSFNISWTASALQGVGGNIESVRKCSNHCLNEPTYSKHFGVINGECSCNDEMYSVVDNTPTNVSLCIAAKKTDDKPLLSAENCDSFLPRLIVDKAWLISTTKTKTEEATSRYHTSTPLSTVSDNTSVVKWSLIVMVVMVVCLVFVVCLWKCRKRRRAKAERQRPNSVSNRTYGAEMLRQTDDEEYSLITDLARGDVTYRPPQLPVRNGPKTINTEDANIITIDDYSSPSDVIKEDFQSDVADEYSTTYDDPIRHPSRRKKRVANCGSNVKEVNISIVAIQHKEEMSDTDDADVSTLLKMESNIIARINAGSQDVDMDIDECVTKEEDFKTSAETISQTNSEDIKKLCVTENNAITGAGLCAGRSDTEEDSESVYHPAHSYEILVGNAAALAEKLPAEMEMNYEDTNIIDGNFPKKLKASNTKLNDYEGTDVIDGKYPTKPKLVFSEHVCLDCLSPEHLQKFGITIISDDDYCGSHESVKSSLSEPLHHSCYNEEVDDQVSVIQRENSGIKPSKHIPAGRECNVCHTIYDELGMVKQKQWDRNTDNVYDKFCKYKHTKRENLTKKRLKSS